MTAEPVAPQKESFAGLGRFDAVVGVTCVAICAGVAVVFPRYGLSTALGGVVVLAEAVAALTGLLFFYGWRQEPRITAVLRMTIWTLVLSNLCLLPMYVPMRSAVPLADSLLARSDHAMGFDDGAIVRWASAHPLFGRVSERIYYSLNVLCVVAVIATSFMHRVDRAKNLLLAILVAVVVTLVVAYFVPAVGPWETSQFIASGEQIHCGRVIRVLKGVRPFTVDMGSPDPIIATPSWHVILAVLDALALWPIRVLGIVSAAWAMLIVLSTLTTGWHYLTDVLAGIFVAVGSHVFARRFLLPWMGASRAA